MQNFSEISEITTEHNRKEEKCPVQTQVAPASIESNTTTGPCTTPDEGENDAATTTLQNYANPIVLKEYFGYGFYTNYWAVSVVQFVHLLLFLVFTFVIFYFEKPTSSYINHPGSIYLSASVLALSILSSIFRAVFNNFSFLAFLLNYHYIKELKVRGNFQTDFIGQTDPGIDLGVLCQYISYTGFFVLIGWNSQVLFITMAILIAVLDFIFARYRFVHGKSSLKEGWKRVPLINSERSVYYPERKVGKVYALSYRWMKENASGLCDDNIAAVINQAKEFKLEGGFIDAICLWENGNMATLDVNKSIYTNADKHIIFSSYKEYLHYLFRMRWKFCLFLGIYVFLCYCYWGRLGDSGTVAIGFFFMFIVIIIHLRHYVTWGMQSIVPGFKRVWLRLEYECRRNHDEPSILMTKQGIFQQISFQESWIYSLRSLVWLVTLKGAPICILPDPSDFSGLSSRKWVETIDLIDAWSGYKSPSPEIRRKWSSMVMADHPDKGEESINGVSVETHIVGGEIVYSLFGYFYKFDGYLGKVSTTRIPLFSNMSEVKIK